MGAAIKYDACLLAIMLLEQKKNFHPCSQITWKLGINNNTFLLLLRVNEDQGQHRTEELNQHFSGHHLQTEENEAGVVLMLSCLEDHIVMLTRRGRGRVRSTSGEFSAFK